MNWDRYFMEIAKTVSLNSKCQSRKIGAVIVTPDNAIVSTGYNGVPPRVPHCNERTIPITSPEGYRLLVLPESANISSWETDGRNREDGRDVIWNEYGVCPRRLVGYKSGQGMQYCLAQHAEENTIHTAALTGVSTRGTKIYCYCPAPCVHCSGAIIRAGITEVICLNLNEYQDEVSALDMFKQAGVKIRMVK